jgi:RecB family exonuclease
VQGRLVGTVTSLEVVPAAAQVRSFVADAVRWYRSGDQTALLRLIRSPLSGVAHDVAAAYATHARRTGALLDAIDASRPALPPADRESALVFAQRVRRIRALPPDLDDRALHGAIVAVFEFSPEAPNRNDKAAGLAHRGDFELTLAAAPESPANVAGWQRHFSASALNTFAECPRKWFYKYVCAAVEDPGSAASAYGTAVHSALEDFHGEFPRPKARDAAAMRARIREHITWAFERNRSGFETAVEFELQVRRAQRTVQRYVNWLLAMEREAPFEVLGREVAANLELEGRPFVGYIDRLDRDERSGGVSVVDYKTGNIAATPAEYGDKVRRFRDFQLPFYYWARTDAGDRVTKLVLIPLKDAMHDVRPVVLTVGGNITIAELERSRARMIELSDLLGAGRIADFEPTTDPAACTYCNYASACLRRPPAETDRFGS